MITENRKNITRKMLPAVRNRVSGVSGIPKRSVTNSSAGRVRESSSMVAAASSQLTEYSTRICARRTEASTSSRSTMLKTVVTFNNASISISSRRQPAAVILQYVDKHAEKHVKNVVHR